jgi:uncharacterized protein YndB with AHSA1/START domain
VTQFPAVVMERELKASAERVFQAWTDPTQLVHWFRGNPGTKVESAEVDLRVGGRYRIVIRSEDDEFIVFGTYSVVDPPRVLEFTWRWEVSSLEPADTLVRVELQPTGAGTHLRLTHTNFSTERSSKAHDQGWTGVLATLESYLD